MKCVIFVNSLLGLITAVQIREYSYKNCEFDIIISDMVSELKSIYENNVLQEKFNNVKFVSYKEQNKLDRLMFFVSPEKYMRKLLGENINYYTDIFFWNPTLLLHSCLMYLDKHNKHYNLHVYGDALGSYVTDYPFDNEHFRNDKLNNMLKHVKGFKYVEDMDYDYYVFSSKYISFIPKHTIVDIPEIKPDIIEYYNRLFNYDEKALIRNKVIFMDKQHEDQFAGEDYGLEIINEIINFVGKKDVIVKPHPRQNLSIYSKDKIDILRLGIPWELYCFNNDISEKIVVSYGSTALYMPYILNNKQEYTLINIKLKSRFEITFKKEYGKFIEKFKNINSNFYEVENIEQLRSVLKHVLNLKDC